MWIALQQGSVFQIILLITAKEGVCGEFLLLFILQKQRLEIAYFLLQHTKINKTSISGFKFLKIVKANNQQGSNS